VDILLVAIRFSSFQRELIVEDSGVPNDSIVSTQAWSERISAIKVTCRSGVQASDYAEIDMVRIGSLSPQGVSTSSPRWELHGREAITKCNDIASEE
jgi:hypothetical protein